MSLPIGRTLAHYRITAALGAGGMGEVYRATDTKLGRDVALKVLPAEMAASPERLERFRREAKALAALDHPGVVGVYSVEESDGVHFLTMQLVEGESLDRLIPEGGLPVDADPRDRHGTRRRARRRSRQGHRPPRPQARQRHGDDGRAREGPRLRSRANEPGRGPSAGGSELPTDLHTREGVVMGTVPYMSPEQVSGRAGGPPDRHLLPGGHALRDGDRAAAVPGQLLGRARLRDPARHAAAARRAAGRPARGAGGGDRALPREGARGPASRRRVRCARRWAPCPAGRRRSRPQ